MTATLAATATPPTKSSIRRRPLGDASAFPSTLSPLLRRLYAARGAAPHEINYSLDNILHPKDLKDITAAADILADAVQYGRKIVIAGDYDADGAGATSVAMLGFKAMGLNSIDYVIPDRITMGYGLSPVLADMAKECGADVLLTVDNGIAAHAGLERARSLGLTTVVTDHHLPGNALPVADAIVNPTQPGCTFGSKNLAGVGVMFYTLCAVRQTLRQRGWFNTRPLPNFADLLDIVALSTVGDVVRLDYNNRILVEQGLRRIRSGALRPGIAALIQVAGLDYRRLAAVDFGFRLCPRINAAGRIEDIRTGIECLIAQDSQKALDLAMQLDQLNRTRRELEGNMREEAMDMAAGTEATGVVLYRSDWAEGVVGLVSGKIKESLYRPTIAFTDAHDGSLKGSGRSIEGAHLRDILASIDSQHPGLIRKFGGHAMAAGLSIERDKLDVFSQAFDQACVRQLSPDQLARTIETDGELAPSEISLKTVHDIAAAGPWGQGFQAPQFEGEFKVLESKTMGKDGSHARYRVRAGDQVLTAVHFGGAEQLRPAGASLAMVYQPTRNEWNGRESVDLHVVDQM